MPVGLVKSVSIIVFPALQLAVQQHCTSHSTQHCLHSTSQHLLIYLRTHTSLYMCLSIESRSHVTLSPLPVTLLLASLVLCNYWWLALNLWTVGWSHAFVSWNKTSGWLFPFACLGKLLYSPLPCTSACQYPCFLCLLHCLWVIKFWSAAVWMGFIELLRFMSL